MASLDPEDIEDLELQDDNNDSLPEDNPQTQTLMYITDEEEQDPFAKYTDILNENENEEQKEFKLTAYTKEQNQLTVYGFIRKTQNNDSFPVGIKDICCSYNFIDIRDIFPSNNENPSWWKMLTKAKSECYANNFLLATEICKQFIANNHKEAPSFHSMLGMIYGRMQLKDLAEIEYQTAIKLEPQNVAYLWNYSAFLRTLCRYKQASELLLKALKRDPKDISYKFEYANCLRLIDEENGDYEHREKYSEKFEEITFTLRLIGGHINKKYQSDAKNNLYTALSYKYLDDIEGMEKEYNTYLDAINLGFLTENITAFARLLYLLEKYDEALKLINHAFNKDKATPFTYYYYGLIMKIKGEYKIAKESFENALRFSSDFIKCRKEYQLLLSQHFSK